MRNLSLPTTFGLMLTYVCSWPNPQNVPSSPNQHTVSPNASQPIYPPNGPVFPVKAPVPNSTYDYIVVGFGPGGAPVAARLALAGYSVLLVDAGEDHGTDRQVQVPALHVLSSEYDPIRWDYFVNHYDDEAQAKRDTKMTYLTPEGDWYSGSDPPRGSQRLGILYPRVGALGGCSQHNALITVLPNDGDRNNMAEITGDASWRSSSMRKYFQRLENCQYVSKGAAGHGFAGWLKTQLTPLSLVVQDDKILSLVVAAATAMGMDIIGKIISTITGLAEVSAVHGTKALSPSPFHLPSMSPHLILLAPLGPNPGYQRRLIHARRGREALPAPPRHGLRLRSFLAARLGRRYRNRHQPRRQQKVQAGHRPHDARHRDRLRHLRLPSKGHRRLLPLRQEPLPRRPPRLQDGRHRDARHRARLARSDPLGRRIQHAAAAEAERHRPTVGTRAHRQPREPRPPGGGRQHAGPLRSWHRRPGAV